MEKKQQQLGNKRIEQLFATFYLLVVLVLIQKVYCRVIISIFGWIEGCALY